MSSSEEEIIVTKEAGSKPEIIKAFPYLALLTLSQLACGKEELTLTFGGIAIMGVIFFTTIYRMDKKIDDNGFEPHTESPDYHAGHRRYKAAKQSKAHELDPKLEAAFNSLVDPDMMIPTITAELNEKLIKPVDFELYKRTPDGEKMVKKVTSAYKHTHHAAKVNRDMRRAAENYMTYVNELAAMINEIKQYRDNNNT